jgi:hypothetical protein
MILPVQESGEMTVAGYWTLNHELSDQASSFSESADTKTVQALLRELLALHEHLTVAPTEHDVITIVDGQGVSRVYHTSGLPELQEFQAGSAETRTVWEGRWLRQEIQVNRALRIVRTYQPVPELERLIETIVVEDDPGPFGRPLIRVYESDRVR